jgi:hypothetical protein
MLAQPVMAPWVLSSGSTCSPPSILPLIGDAWPTGGSSAVSVTFYDSTGAVLATAAGTMTASSIDFTIAHTVIDSVPAGASFEVFVTDASGNPYKIRYGRVVRRQASFFDAPGSLPAAQALSFADALQRTALGSNWIPIVGTTKMFTNTGPLYGAGSPNVLLGTSNSAIRWFTPLNTDSVSVNVNLLNEGYGKTTIILCSDIALSTYLGAQFDTNANTVQLLVGTGSTTGTNEGSAVANTVAATPDNYTITYNNNSGALSVYKGTSLSALASWTDSGHIVPHGPGYRYLGMNWINGNLTNGCQVSAWAGADDV